MRNKLRSFLLLGCIVSTTALGVGPVLADETAQPAAGDHCQGHRPGQHGRHGFHRMMKALKLSDQQRVQAKALFRSNRQIMKPLFVGLITAKHQLNSLVASGTADPSAIQTQAASVATAESGLAVQKAQNTKQFLALLTAEQLTAYQAIQAKREARFQRFITRMGNPPAAE